MIFRAEESRVSVAFSGSWQLGFRRLRVGSVWALEGFYKGSVSAQLLKGPTEQTKHRLAGLGV